MKRLMSLMQSILADASIWCRTSSTRDFQTITRRVENEGLSFLTITLPKFCSDFERSLDRGFVSPSDFAGFSRSGELPRFLGGFLDLVFNRKSGVLLDTPDRQAIFFIRQICLVCKKIRLPCSEARQKEAFDAYIKCEKEVAAWEESVSSDKLDRFFRISNLLFSGALAPVEAIVADGGLVPRHGPGSVAERLVGNEKFRLTEWTHRLDGSFPSDQFLLPNPGFHELLEPVTFLEPEAERPVRIISVPKTLKSPRIIGIEPCCMQYAQQSILEVLVRALESDKLYGALGFTDQGPNQAKARLGSLTGDLATLDLSEASDRVSNLLVRLMFSNHPHLDAAVQACRSLRADVPGHGIHTISKFASMGSAICFPVEAMVFLTVVAIGYEDSLARTLSRKDVVDFLGRVRIYGDDIIIPADIVQFVTSNLSLYGFKVNANKSFWTGKFRESCGGDYYDGENVTVTYLRRMFPRSRRDVSEMVSAFSFRNQLYKAGLWKTAEYLDTLLNRVAPVPLVSETSPALGRHSFLGFETQKVCRKLFRPLVKAFTIKPIKRKSPLRGAYALLKFFLKRGSDPIFDPKHLERYGRPERVDIKVQWLPST